MDTVGIIRYSERLTVQCDVSARESGGTGGEWEGFKGEQS